QKDLAGAQNQYLSSFGTQCRPVPIGRTIAALEDATGVCHGSGRTMRNRPWGAMVVALIALFFSLGGTAVAALLITSNSQLGKNTISGHHPPKGDHANLIAGSVNAKDLAPGAVSGVVA